MPASGVRMVFDADGNLMMIVKPDNDAQLNDPAFSPKGTVSVVVPKQAYDNAKTTADHYTIAAPIVAQADAIAGDVLNQKLIEITKPAPVVPAPKVALIDPLTKLPYPTPIAGDPILVDAGQVI